MSDTNENSHGKLKIEQLILHIERDEFDHADYINYVLTRE